MGSLTYAHLLLSSLFGFRGPKTDGQVSGGFKDLGLGFRGFGIQLLFGSVVFRGSGSGFRDLGFRVYG